MTQLSLLQARSGSSGKVGGAVQMMGKSGGREPLGKEEINASRRLMSRLFA